MAKSPKPGTAGGFSSPPPGAPHQVSQPVTLTEADIQAAQAKAAERARQRAGPPARDPLRPPPSVLGQPPAPAPASDADGMGRTEGQTHIEETPLGSRAAGQTPIEPPIEPPIEQQQQSGGPPTLDTLTDEFRALHPAASTSDSPARGIPTPSSDPNKQITGGWGPTGSGPEYFALDGSELKRVVLALADRLKHALDADLRFGLSVVYPQVKISLRLTVDGRSPDARDLNLPGQEKIEQDWHRVLTLESEVEDTDTTPAGKIRDDFQIRGPAKQVVRAGAARMLVDVPSGRG